MQIWARCWVKHFWQPTTHLKYLYVSTCTCLPDKVVDTVLNVYSCLDFQVKVINEDTLSSEPHVQRIYRELKDWDWRFGRTPEFTHNLETRFEWGIMDVFFNTKNGMHYELI